MNFKDIHIGNLISQKVGENKVEMSRIGKFFNCTEERVREMYTSESLDTKALLKWSKLLEYDFFRIYTQHLILYAPTTAENKEVKKKTSLPKFRKNIYTKDIIDFILGQIQTGEMTKKQVIEGYGIPKTTLYKWMIKYRKNEGPLLQKRLIRKGRR